MLFFGICFLLYVRKTQAGPPVKKIKPLRFWLYEFNERLYELNYKTKAVAKSLNWFSVAENGLYHECERLIILRTYIYHINGDEFNYILLNIFIYFAYSLCFVSKKL